MKKVVILFAVMLITASISFADEPGLYFKIKVSTSAMGMSNGAFGDSKAARRFATVPVGLAESINQNIFIGYGFCLEYINDFA